MKNMVVFLSVFALAIGACTDDLADEPPPGTEPEKLELSMTATIPAGAEVEYCQFVTVPETWVRKDTVEFSPGSHHVLAYQTAYTSVPTQKKDGTPVDTSGVFDCSEGGMNGWLVTKPIGGSQNQHGDSLLAFPDGVAARIGGIVLLNVHYRNGSDAPLAAEAKIVFDTIAPDQVVHEGDLLFLYNPLISVPPGSTSRARWRCPVYQDITIVNAQSHMHARGFGFEARIDAQAPFYVGDRWEDVPVQRYEGLTVKAGSKLDYHCDYRNTSGTPIYQGVRTTDEMCMLIGSYYPAEPRTSLCLDETGTLPGGEWIGQGAASCEQTMGCLQAAQGQLPVITDCMLAASPTVSRESSELLRCFMGAQDPLTQCLPQIQACAVR
jgi:hypothetical protein